MWCAMALLPLLLNGGGTEKGEFERREMRASLSVLEQGTWLAGRRTPGAQGDNLVVVQPAFSWRDGQRWRIVTSAAAIVDTADHTHSRVGIREAWGGYTAGDFDCSAGKKILRWSTGYAFTPTGVLDPPRNAADPGDRLSLTEGRNMVAADWVHGGSALTVAWAGGTMALRYNKLVAGFDAALIYAHAGGGPNFAGVNFTRVVGDALEVHGELAHHHGMAALAGGKFTMRSGITFIAEFYSPEAPRRGRYFFANCGKGRLRELPAWKEWDVSVSVLANLSDGSHMFVADVTRRIGDKVSLTGHAEAPRGKVWRSEFGMIPYSARVSIGIRYQL